MGLAVGEVLMCAFGSDCSPFVLGNADREVEAICKQQWILG